MDMKKLGIEEGKEGSQTKEKEVGDAGVGGGGGGEARSGRKTLMVFLTTASAVCVLVFLPLFFPDFLFSLERMN